uniref:uncharacterized protein LOC113474879 isoform X2 n=1 Tax=Ciona intestinalis TaxID=7719 RepID=UPI000EF49D81|nr:uncharacterized protein LOC113474879 isoform X2 [Ciona intestinalis]|eukprot:XP_026693522.1 uncharacterized protein LOC113474879 isoform X2 [Ciona intestinalis]
MASLVSLTPSTDVENQMLLIPDVTNTSNRKQQSSKSSTPLNARHRQGGLKRHRLSHCRITPIRDFGLSPIEKFRRILRSIRIIVEVCLALKRCVEDKEKDEKLSLVEMQMNLQNDFNEKLSFNPRYYCASYIANKGSSKLKKLLAISPDARSKRHVKMIHNLVQNKNAFSKHPVHIQLKMCQVMIYQAYEARRVIIKQGHPPSAFYIILSGTCLVNECVAVESGCESVQTINEIQSGDVFGEVALLNHTTRTASVVCKDDVELLVVSKEDFDAIIRGPIYKQREEVIKYCHSLHILSYWPVEDLTTASFVNFQYQYFRKGATVVRSNFASNFLVIIKSGECRVICTLGDRNQITGSRKTVRRRSVDTEIKLPTLNESSALKTRSKSLGYQLINHADRKSIKNQPAFVGRMLAHPTGGTHTNGHRDISKEIRERKRQIIMETLKMMGNNKRGFQHDRLLDMGDIPETTRPIRTPRTIRASIVEDTPYAVTNHIPSRDRWKRATKLALMKKVTSSNGHFAQIATLTPGCVFGLEEMMQRTELQLTLISNGAECIFISKKMFLKRATPRSLRMIGALVGRYPTEAYIREQLRELNQWKSFKKDVVKHVLEKKDKTSSSVVM